MKFLLDKKECENGRFLPDWEFDHRLDLLREKYKYKRIVLRDEHHINSEISIIRISNMRQLQEFISDFGDITITNDPGYYFDVGCPRIIIHEEGVVVGYREGCEEETLTDEDKVENEISIMNGNGYYDELGMYNSYKNYE